VSWTPQTLEDSIRRQDVYPLYILFGEETYLIDEALAKLEKLALGDGLRDFNLNVYYGDDVAADVIRDAVETLPMMAQMRVVIVKEAQDLSDTDWQTLAPVIENPIDSCALIFVASKIDKRKKHIKRALETGVVVEFKRPFDNQIPEWIQHIARKHEIKMNRDAVALFHQLVGSNLTDLNHEMRKLGQYLGERKQAESEDIVKAVSRLRIENVFDLTEAIGGNDRDRALTCLADLLDHGQNEVGVLALVSRHVRILKLVNEGLREGLSGQRLSTKVGVPPFFLKQYVEQSRNWNTSKIDRTFRLLLETDRALKSSPIDSHIWLENFIVQTCS
jgi:DNA polymerase III subunit delta